MRLSAFIPRDSLGKRERRSPLEARGPEKFEPATAPSHHSVERNVSAPRDASPKMTPPRPYFIQRSDGEVPLLDFLCRFRAFFKNTLDIPGVRRGPGYHYNARQACSRIDNSFLRGSNKTLKTLQRSWCGKSENKKKKSFLSPWTLTTSLLTKTDENLSMNERD